MDRRALQSYGYKAVTSSEMSAIAYKASHFDEWLIEVFVFEFMHTLFVRGKPNAEERNAEEKI
jgi:hypothetical protein